MSTGLTVVAARSIGERRADLLEGIPPDQLLEREPSLPVERDQPRDELPRHRIPFDRAADRLPATDHARQVHRELWDPDADDRERPERGQRRDRLIDDRPLGGRVERVRGAGAGEPADLLHHVCAGRVDRGARAELPGERPAPRHRIDGDDRADANRAGAHHRRQADPAGAEHDEGRLVGRREHVEHGPRPGLDAAAERGGERQIEIGVEHHHVGLVGQRVRGEARLPEVRPVHRRAIAAHGRRAVRARAEPIERAEVPAIGRVAARAFRTGFAAAVAEDDVITRPRNRHVGSNGRHDARALVTEDDRRDRLRPDRLHRQIAVADADGTQLYEQFVGARLVELDLGDLKRRLRTCREGGLDLHRISTVATYKTACKVSIPYAY